MKLLLYVALLLYMLHIQLPKQAMVSLVFTASFTYLVVFYAIDPPHNILGNDAYAFVNQAGQFVAGQTDFFKLNSKQGPCYYGAAEVWHYAMIFKLYVSTNYG